MAIWADSNGLNCRECSQETKQALNCGTDGPEMNIEGIQVKSCPFKTITAQSRIYLQAYAFYMDGHLPGPGNVYDQSNKVMDAINFIGKELKRIEKK